MQQNNATVPTRPVSGPFNRNYINKYLIWSLYLIYKQILLLLHLATFFSWLGIHLATYCIWSFIHLATLKTNLVILVLGHFLHLATYSLGLFFTWPTFDVPPFHLADIFHSAIFGPLRVGRAVGEIFHLATFGPLRGGRAVGVIFHLATFGPLRGGGQLAWFSTWQNVATWQNVTSSFGGFSSLAKSDAKCRGRQVPRTAKWTSPVLQPVSYFRCKCPILLQMTCCK